MDKKDEQRKGISRPYAWMAGRLAAVSAVYIVAVVFAVGCDEVQRRRLLTFFFEGVPSAESQLQPTTSVVNTRVLPAGSPPGKADTPVGRQRQGSRHAPARECVTCHASSFRQYERQLVAPVPQLCHNCHAGREIQGEQVHGPVAVGECTVCHNPHQSGYVHLQAAPQPELCFRCHVQDDMATIPGHQQMEDTICTDCHDPHSSGREKLLKAHVKAAPTVTD